MLAIQNCTFYDGLAFTSDCDNQLIKLFSSISVQNSRKKNLIFLDVFLVYAVCLVKNKSGFEFFKKNDACRKNNSTKQNFYMRYTRC